MINEKRNLMRHLDTLVLTHPISAHTLFLTKDRSFLPESNFECYWFTGDLVLTSSFYKSPKASLRFLKWIWWAPVSDRLFLGYTYRKIDLTSYNLSILFFWHFTTAVQRLISQISQESAIQWWITNVTCRKNHSKTK